MENVLLIACQRCHNVIFAVLHEANSTLYIRLIPTDRQSTVLDAPKTSKDIIAGCSFIGLPDAPLHAYVNHDSDHYGKQKQFDASYQKEEAHEEIEA